MRLTSRFPFPVFWRTFNANDTVYVFGNFEGVLFSGQFVDINHPSGRFQMELKRDGIGGVWIRRPGEIFTNTENRVVQLRVVNGVPVADLLKV